MEDEEDGSPELKAATESFDAFRREFTLAMTPPKLMERDELSLPGQQVEVEDPYYREKWAEILKESVLDVGVEIVRTWTKHIVTAAHPAFRAEYDWWVYQAKHGGK